jgi:hypothetical protein
LEISGTHQILVCVDDVNLLGKIIYTIMKNKAALLDASEEINLVVTAEKTK